MIKYVFILINFLTVFLYSLFNGDGGITVIGSIPSTVKAGQELPIEIKITKGTMAGFAKFQLELPDGIAIKETENKGANYTYSEGVGKWVWASLPNENDFTIKITLITSDEATGIKTVRGKFSYVEDNTKQVVEMVPAEITITEPDSEAPAPNPPLANKTPAKTNDPDSLKAAQEALNAQNSTTTNNDPSGNINVVRTITKGGNDNEYNINLKIKKGITKGFARYSDDLPEGLIVKSSKTDGSSFSVGDGKLKFVWVNVPDKNELELEYTISGNTVVTEVNLRGEYSYLEENQSKKFTLGVDKINFPAPAQSLADAAKEENTNQESEAGKTTQAKMEQNMAKKEGSVDYHVQIGAFTNAKVDASRLKKVFKVKESISSEMTGGFSKFLVGSHLDYSGARDHREVMKNNNGIKSAFVVAYNGSKRITVQEALMMTNQKWFK